MEESFLKEVILVVLSSLVHGQLKEKSCLKLDVTKEHQLPCFALLQEMWLLFRLEGG